MIEPKSELIQDYSFIEVSHYELLLSIGNTLNAANVTILWKKFDEIISTSPPKKLVIDASKLINCHTIGFAFLTHCKETCKERGIIVEVSNLNDKYIHLIDFFGILQSKEEISIDFKETKVEAIGKKVSENIESLEETMMFIGEVTYSFLKFLKNPFKNLRWSEVFVSLEKSGVNALPLILLIGFLFGLIISFQSSIPMQRFGAQVFIANLVSLSLFRELGPLLTAIILAARSGSSYAAEIGTMKVSEELDALFTMGLHPIPYLILPRLIAGFLLSPILTVFLILSGLFGSSLVVMSLGFSFPAFINQATVTVKITDFIGGLVKSSIFGLLVSGIGCLSGLQTKEGAAAVGISTTKAVVVSIISISIADGLFSLVYYILGI